MTDKEYRDQVKRVKLYIDKWYKPLGLGWHQIDMNWSRVAKEENPNAAAETMCLWQYRTGWITWYLPVIVGLNDDQLEGTVVHEFAHVLTWPLWENAGCGDNKENEYATEEVARALIWIRQTGAKEAKKA